MNDLEKATQIDFFCIGTPRVIGDALGPLVGTILSFHNFQVDVKVIGTMDKPVTLSNYTERLSELRPGATVVVVDAALGPDTGKWELLNESLIPGHGVASGLQPVGDWCVKAYTGKDLTEMFLCPAQSVYMLANDIATALTDMINVQKRVFI